MPAASHENLIFKRDCRLCDTSGVEEYPSVRGYKYLMPLASIHIPG